MNVGNNDYFGINYLSLKVISTSLYRIIQLIVDKYAKQVQCLLQDLLSKNTLTPINKVGIIAISFLIRV
jgi:hypothetical protein